MNTNTGDNTIALHEQDSLKDFLALARIALTGYDNSTQETWQEPLARLLAAAAQGTGHLPAKTLLGQRSTSDMPTELISIENGEAMLPRIASAWKNVRQWIEHASSRKKHLAAEEDIQQALNDIFPRDIIEEGDQVIFDNAHQRLAVAQFIDAYGGVLTGGPGTGKTTTAAALIALHKRLQPALSSDDILVCAPTGKAANRLQDSLRSASQRLQLKDDEIQFLNDIRTSTIHRALGWSRKHPEDGGPFTRNAHNPLTQSLVIMDEASMCDIELMSHCIRALGPESSMILLGDRDQLDSVEAGGVLAELVLRGAAGELTDDIGNQLAQRCQVERADIEQWQKQALPQAHSSVSALPGLAIGLHYSWRAKHAPWVLELAQHFRPHADNTTHTLQECFATWNHKNQLQCIDKRQQLIQQCTQHWQALHAASANWSIHQLPTSQDLQQCLHQFQLLCATNAQVLRANQTACQLASGKDEGSNTKMNIMHGCPILIESNARELNLSNGDIGIAIGDGPHSPARWVLFADQDQTLALSQLPKHSPAYALTIHKSQGSEWKNVAIELSHKENDLLDLNLLYTAITRSSGSVTLCAQLSFLDNAIQTN